MRNSLEAALVRSVDAYKSNAVLVPEWARFASLVVPAIDNGVVSLEVILKENSSTAALLASNDTGWMAIYDESESAQVAASGADPGCYDITTYVRGLPDGCCIRAVCATQQTTADVTFTFTFAN